MAFFSLISWRNCLSTLLLENTEQPLDVCILKSLACPLSFLNFTIWIKSPCSWNIYVQGQGPQDFGWMCVCFCCGYAVWQKIKNSQGDISLNWGHKRPRTSPSCVHMRRWVCARRRVIWKVTAGWVCLLFSVHLQPIKRQDWQICPPPSPPFLLSSTPAASLCPCFLSSSLVSFSFLFLLP